MEKEENDQSSLVLSVRIHSTIGVVSSLQWSCHPRIDGHEQQYPWCRCKRAIFSSLNATVFATRKTNPKLIEEEFTRVSLLLLFSFFLFFFSFRENSRYRCTFLPVPTRGDNRQPSENPFHPRKLIMTDVLLPPVFYPRERARSNVSALWKPREAFTHWYHPFG